MTWGPSFLSPVWNSPFFVSTLHFLFHLEPISPSCLVPRGKGSPWCATFSGERTGLFWAEHDSEKLLVNCTSQRGQFRAKSQVLYWFFIYLIFFHRLIHFRWLKCWEYVFSQTNWGCLYYAWWLGEEKVKCLWKAITEEKNKEKKTKEFTEREKKHKEGGKGGGSLATSGINLSAEEGSWIVRWGKVRQERKNEWEENISRHRRNVEKKMAKAIKGE